MQNPHQFLTRVLTPPGQDGEAYAWDDLARPP
jgi:hypothetical protein